MRYQIAHTTNYRYSDPAILGVHRLQLRPRSDALQTLHQFELDISPSPQQHFEGIDLDGNQMDRVWFPEQPTRSLSIAARSIVETHCSNPFNYLLESWAVMLPIEYPAAVLQQLQIYLAAYFPGFSGQIDAIAAELAQEVWHMTGGNTLAFLMELNLKIWRDCRYVLRETGLPYPPGITWREKQGSCRDLTVLFMEACRAVGLAARFVSGYEAGDPSTPENHLHAWAEVYLPGAGWRGYDPTHGLAVSDRHIALAAASHPKSAAPISGRLRQGSSQSNQLSYTLSIEPLEDSTEDSAPVSSQVQHQSLS